MAEANKKYLIPTKATLFGLEIRFRHIDQKIAEERAQRARTRGGKSKSKLEKIDPKQRAASNHPDMTKNKKDTTQHSVMGMS